MTTRIPLCLFAPASLLFLLFFFFLLFSGFLLWGRETERASEWREAGGLHSTSFPYC